MKSSRSVTRILVIAGITALAGAPARADVITVWNQQVVTNGGPQIQRTLAMVHIAMFDAVNAIERDYKAYLRLPKPPDGASAEAAAAAPPTAFCCASSLHNRPRLRRRSPVRWPVYPPDRPGIPELHLAISSLT